MNQLIAFTKKECMDVYRSGKLLIMGIVFVILGIMNPAIAKLTPYLFKTLGSELEEQGIKVIDMTVTANTSWTQFYKNVPLIGIILLIVMFSGIMTNEYQKGTLINMLTKGLVRWKVIAAKLIVSAAIWTICYWLSYGITYIYTDYFWKNEDVCNLFIGAFCAYVVGLMLLIFIMAGSVISNSVSGCMMFTVGMGVVMYIIGIVPKLSKYTPMKLMSSQTLITNAEKVEDFIPALIITAAISIVTLIAAIIGFNKKQLV